MKPPASFVLAALLLAGPAPVAADDAEAKLTATFIGNEAFAITDGETTLVSDFPYQSGYSLYMEYDPAALEIAGDVVALITHRHADHFDAKLFAGRDWKIVGPREVTDAFGATSPVRVIPLQDQTIYRDIRITPVKTAHSGTEHFSYLVEWLGRSLYFFGDTEQAYEFLRLDDEVDVVFMTPWVLRLLLANGANIPAKLIVIYHQQVGETLPQCSKCRALVQGESFTLD